MSRNNVRTTLQGYIKNKNTWFHWYHDINRLERIREYYYSIDMSLSEDKRKLSQEKDFFLDAFKEEKGYPDDILNEFFECTLDEVRIQKANDFAYYALYISDKRSFSYFRRAESKREVSGEMDFEKQRDHSVHTLYNYIFGWYMLENMPDFFRAFRGFFKERLSIELIPSDDEKRFYDDNSGCRRGLDIANFSRDFSLINNFGDVWPIASLLHDVGYILEGSLSASTSEVEHERVINGAKVINDYFHHYLWRHAVIDFRAAIAVARNVECEAPDFRGTKSMAALSDRLRDIGNLDNIRQKGDKSIRYLENCKDKYSLNREGFKLWDIFYCGYVGRTHSSQKDPYYVSDPILKNVLDKYTKEVWEGGNTSRIMLNHGVSGGLMLLQASTFWYQFMWGMESLGWEHVNEIQEKQKDSGLTPVTGDFISKGTFDLIRQKVTAHLIPAHIHIRGGFNFASWLKDLWATAAVAIHDYVTLESWSDKKKIDYFSHSVDESKSGDNGNYKIKLEEDPLAYLQVLVDLLQEWDRYTVLGESAFLEEQLLQSHEMVMAVGREFFSFFSVSLDMSPGSEHMDIIGIDSVSENKIYIRYPKRPGLKDYKGEIIKLLDGALKDWSKHVDIDTYNAYKVRRENRIS